MVRSDRVDHDGGRFDGRVVLKIPFTEWEHHGTAECRRVNIEKTSLV